MILSDRSIINWANGGGIDPFVMKNVNPASIDLRVGNIWIDYHGNKKKLIYKDSILLYPRTAITDIWNFFARIFELQSMITVVAGVTIENINIPNGMAAMVKLKSSKIREGLGYPIADWVDPGYEGKLTLMFTAHRKIRLYCGDRVVQLVLQSMEMCDVPYNFCGHYMNQVVPTI